MKIPAYSAVISLPGNKQVDVGKFAHAPELLFNGLADALLGLDQDTVIVYGGTSLTANFLERLQNELNEGTNLKCLVASTPTERRHAVWIGGSILGSLGSFAPLIVSQQEYAEHGLAVVNKKCP